MISARIGGFKKTSPGKMGGYPYCGRGRGGQRNGSIHKATSQFSETTLSQT
jgi:hypothetical protein